MTEKVNELFRKNIVAFSTIFATGSSKIFFIEAIQGIATVSEQVTLKMTVFYIYNRGETQYNGNCSVGTPQDVVSPPMNTTQAVESAIPF